MCSQILRGGGGGYKQNENPMMGRCYSGYTELAFQVGQFKRLCLTLDIPSYLIKDAHADSVLNLTREPKLQGHLVQNTFWEVTYKDWECCPLFL